MSRRWSPFEETAGEQSDGGIANLPYASCCWGQVDCSATDDDDNPSAVSTPVENSPMRVG